MHCARLAGRQQRLYGVQENDLWTTARRQVPLRCLDMLGLLVRLRGPCQCVTVDGNFRGLITT